MISAAKGTTFSAGNAEPRGLACRRERCDGSESASPTAASENFGHGSPARDVEDEKLAGFMDVTIPPKCGVMVYNHVFDGF